MDGSMVETFAALAEPNRFRIVEELRGGPRSVGALCGALHQSQPLVSKHLRVLRDAGLVIAEPQARQRLYELRPQPLRALDDWLGRYRRIWEARFTALDDVLAELEAEGAPRSPTSTAKHPKAQARAQRPGAHATRGGAPRGAHGTTTARGTRGRR